MQPFLPPCRHHIVHLSAVSRTLSRGLDCARGELVAVAQRPARTVGEAACRGGALGALVAQVPGLVSGLRAAGEWAVPGWGGAAGLVGYLLVGRGAPPAGPAFATDTFTLRRLDADAPMGLAGSWVTAAACRAADARYAGCGLAEAAWTAAAIGLAVGLELVRVGLLLAIIAGMIAWAPYFAAGGAVCAGLVQVCHGSGAPPQPATWPA